MPVESSVSIVVKDRDDNGQLVLEQVREMAGDDVRFWCDSIQPYLEAERDLYGGGQDAHWVWDEKYDLTFEDDTYGFTLALASAPDYPQGLMLVKKAPAPPMSMNAGKSISYVDLLATADWNRPTVRFHPKHPEVNLYKVRPGRYSAVGTNLLGRALRLADELKLPSGVIGLHSLPLAGQFYASLGMKCFGRDSNKEDLDYFEFDSSTGTNLLSGLRTAVVNYGKSNSLTQIRPI
ncbi:MAG: hypothetical protein QNJ97_28190 [Myxococcota bacterium]|nr:hypothetical protein [Myxococcota bacterium]